MIIEDFIGNLTAKFRSKIDEENDVFCSDLNSFVTAVRPECLQDIYNRITMEHTFQTIPRMGKFWKIAKAEKYLVLRESKQLPYWNICRHCGCTYSKTGRGCPKCRCTVAKIGTGETLPENIIDVQEDCFYCTIYPESLKQSNHQKLYFHGCGDYGIKQDKHCSACQCKECCRQMIQYNNYPVNTTEQYKSTELAQPWIKEVEPISQMAADMLKHMKETRFKEFK